MVISRSESSLHTAFPYIGVGGHRLSSVQESNDVLVNTAASQALTVQNLIQWVRVWASDCALSQSLEKSLCYSDLEKQQEGVKKT